MGVALLVTFRNEVILGNSIIHIKAAEIAIDDANHVVFFQRSRIHRFDVSVGEANGGATAMAQVDAQIFVIGIGDKFTGIEFVELIFVVVFDHGVGEDRKSSR